MSFIGLEPEKALEAQIGILDICIHLDKNMNNEPHSLVAIATP